MNRSAAARVERHLRRLDADACAALVADLWAARGFDVRREGRRVTATRRGTTTAVHVATGVRAGGVPGGRVDVVVAPDGGRAGRRLAEATGADLLDAADLRRTLRYAVDAATAADLCVRHLGARPADLRPPLGERLRNRTRVGSGSAMPALVAVVLLVLAGGAFAVPHVGTAGDAATPAGDGTGATEAGAAGANGSGAASVPGLSAERIADVDALAAAHERGLEGRSYTLRYDYRGPPDWGVGRGSIHRHTEATVDGERFFLSTTVEADGVRVDGKSVYHDGEGWYVAGGPDDDYRYIPESGGAPSVESDPSELRRILVYRYLSTPSTTVVGPVVRDGETLYRVEGHGRPEGMPYVDALDYSVRAHVDRSGVVRSLTATYALETDGGRTTVTVSVRHERLGETTVTPPAGV
ncbi:MAG: hypothetical protein ABEH47_04675, partial [Haloferacaceae archaeon]